jgi:hypothetical protein
MKPQSPKPEELINLRECHRLTQRRAARLVFSSLRAWQYWEGGKHLMHPAIWRYAQIAARRRTRLIAEAKAKAQLLPTVGDIKPQP